MIRVILRIMKQINGDVLVDFGQRHAVVGGSNVILCLPMGWCKAHRIGKGSTLRVLVTRDGDLLVRAEGGSENGK